VSTKNEHKLIRLLLDHDFWEENKQHINRSFFPGDLVTIYDTIARAHKEFERSLSLDEIKTLIGTWNPSLTRATKTNIYELMQDIDDDEPFGPDVAQQVLQYMFRQDVFRQIADLGLDGMEGRVDSLSPLSRIIETHDADFMPVQDVEPVTADFDEVFDALDSRQSWRFNIPTLAQQVPGGCGGDFMVAFARPEAGKTAFHVSLTCGPNGFLKQGATVLTLVNEEPAIRTRARGICAATEMNKEQALQNRDGARAMWNAVKDGWILFDDVDMTIEKLDAICKKRQPDILVIDQIDKVNVFGSYSRQDQRLREIYKQAREIAKRHDIFVIGICQASADAEGKTKVTYAMMEESKTGKAAEADLIVGIGRRATDEGQPNTDDTHRYLTVSKNKITGWHGTIGAILEGDKSIYRAGSLL
jgi:replicative DNA helicase